MQTPFTNAPLLKVDSRRNNKYQPGQLLTSVELDRKALECFYCARTCPFCCCKGELAEATFMDVYTNSAVIGHPLYCFCCSTSTGSLHHYDDWAIFNEPAQKGEMCSPFPFCCVDRFGCFGEVLVMRGQMCTGVRLFGLGNQCNTPTYCALIACCTPISVMYGLAPGEADRVASVINGAVATFKNGQWQPEVRVAAATAANGAAYGAMQTAPPVMGYEQQGYTKTV